LKLKKGAMKLYIVFLLAFLTFEVIEIHPFSAPIAKFRKLSIMGEKLMSLLIDNLKASTSKFACILASY